MTPAEPTLEELAAEPAESVVRTYLERWDAHDVEGMMALLGDGAVFVWEGAGIQGDRDSWFRRCAWPMAAGFAIEGYELEVEDDETVHVTLEQTLELYDLLDYSLPTREITFTVTDGIIQRIQHHEPPEEEVLAEIVAYKEALAPVIAWAQRHRPWEAEELFARGEVLDYSGKRIRELRRRARRHLLLVEDYRNATELADLTRDQINSFKWRLEPDGGGSATMSASYLDPEAGEMVSDNRRLDFRSLDELPNVLYEIVMEDERQRGVWRECGKASGDNVEGSL